MASSSVRAILGRSLQVHPRMHKRPCVCMVYTLACMSIHMNHMQVCDRIWGPDTDRDRDASAGAGDRSEVGWVMCWGWGLWLGRGDRSECGADRVCARPRPHPCSCACVCVYVTLHRTRTRYAHTLHSAARCVCIHIPTRTHTHTPRLGGHHHRHRQRWEQQGKGKHMRRCVCVGRAAHVTCWFVGRVIAGGFRCRRGTARWCDRMVGKGGQYTEATVKGYTVTG